MTQNIAIVGLGDHALQSHVKHLKNMPNVILAGAFDPADKGFAIAQDEYDVALKRYKTYEDILTDNGVTAVLISSPDHYHLLQLEAAVNAGKHVFCEKPMCNAIDEAQRLEESLQLAKSQGLVVTSCHPRRYDPPYVWLKKNLPALRQRFGQPMELALDFTYHQPSKSGLHGGSMLQDHFNHEIDYLHYLFGHVNFDAVKLHDEEDRYHAAGIRDDGLGFNFKGTRRLQTRSYAESVHLRFEKGDVHIDTYAPERCSIYDHHKPHEPAEAITDIKPTDYDTRFQMINRNWVDTMNGIAENYLTEKDMITNSYLSVAFATQKQLRYEF